MRKDRSRFWLCLAVALVAILYTGILLLLKPKLDLSAWTLYAFTMIAFVLLIVQLAFGTVGFETYPQYEYINTVLAFGYTLIQFVLGGIILMLFDGVPLVPIVCTEAIVLAIYLICTFILSAVLSHTESQEQRINKSLTSSRLLITDLETMAAAQSDDVMKEKLHAAAKEIRYQDVVSSPEIASLNLQIQQCVEQVRIALECKDEDADSAMENLNRKLMERKMKCKALKR